VRRIKMGVMILRTIGFITKVKPEIQAKIMEYTLKHINTKTDMIVFYPHIVNTHYEDDYRTLITYMDGLTEKVYAKLDDFGDPKEWNKLYEPEIVKELRQAPNCRYTITFMLASEY
jgi:hypothetical protein